jgi:4-hydroxy-tetrahydrodipicolinate reductase
MTRLRLAVLGASGRMGRTLLRAAVEAEDFELAGAGASPRSAVLGRDAGEVAGLGALGVPLGADPAMVIAGADVAIDFSLPGATRDNLHACRVQQRALVLGTTGLAAGLETELAAAARELPLLVAPNTSLAVALLMRFVSEASVALPGFDLEIAERHHRGKLDAPSGTALALARVAALARGLDPDAALRTDRTSRSGPREQGSIGIGSLRAGSIVGEHEALFAGEFERLELTHRALDRMAFARGALAAARWLAGRPPGLYVMDNVLGASARAAARTP